MGDGGATIEYTALLPQTNSAKFLLLEFVATTLATGIASRSAVTKMIAVIDPSLVDRSDIFRRKTAGPGSIRKS